MATSKKRAKRSKKTAGRSVSASVKTAKQPKQSRLIFLIVGLILVFALFIACGIGSSKGGMWFKNGKFSTWLDYWGKGAPIKTVTPKQTAPEENDFGDDNNDDDGTYVVYMNSELTSGKVKSFALSEVTVGEDKSAVQSDVIQPRGAVCPHAMKVWAVYEEATCTEEGTEHENCEMCGEYMGNARAIAALGHSSEVFETVDATCTTDGYKKSRCSRCQIDMGTETLAATGQHSSELSQTIAATCTENGAKIYTCTVCGTETSRETITATGHNSVYSHTEGQSCTTDGEKVYKCSVCGAETGREAVSALGHDLSKLTSTAEYYKTYQCSRCNMSVVSFTNNPTKEGCTFVGWYYGDGTHCSDGCRAYVGEAIYSDIQLHAHFNVNAYAVTYISDGSEIAREMVNYGTSANVTTPEKTGYNFLGWFYSDGTKYTGQAITGDTTLTAQWQIIRLTVSFYVDGELYTTIEIDYGTAIESLNHEAEAMYLNIVSYLDENGAAADLSNGATSSITIQAEKMSVISKCLLHLKFNWYWLVGAVVVLFALGATAVVVQKKKTA